MDVVDGDSAAGEAVDDPMAVAVGAVSVVSDVAERDGHRVDVVDVFGTFHEPPAAVRGPLAEAVDTFLASVRERVDGMVGAGGHRARRGVGRSRQGRTWCGSVHRHGRRRLGSARCVRRGWASGEKLREFERLVDINGANQDADAAHKARALRLSTVGETTYLSGQMTNAQAAAIKAALDAFAQSEYLADCEHAKGLHGDDDSQAQLPRSARQRRIDALSAICEAAASAPLDGNGVDVCVNVVIDVLTFQRQLVLIADPLHRHPHLFDTGADGDGTGATTPGLRSLCQTSDRSRQRGDRMRTPQPHQIHQRAPHAPRPNGHWHTYRADHTEIRAA